MERIPMTSYGFEQLNEELHRLKTIERPRITHAIAEARAHGDLKENAEYHAAREQQSFNEGRIHAVENKVSLAQVIDVNHIENTGKVIFGVTVELINIDSDERQTYQIVGEDESNIQAGKISIKSPIARAVIGKSIDDIVEVQTPKGLIEFEIAKVEHL